SNSCRKSCHTIRGSSPKIKSMRTLMNHQSVEKLIQEHKIQFIDLRFTDLRGKEHHITLPKEKLAGIIKNGKAIDGSSFPGWKEINHSDLFLFPDLSTTVLDFFSKIPTLNIRCDIIDPSTNAPYFADPRAVAKRAEEYLKATGIADVCYF